MGDKQQELEASVELIVDLAERNAYELLEDVAYGRALVLAAPDLLAACKAARMSLGCDAWASDCDSVRILEAAIAKAEGTD